MPTSRSHPDDNTPEPANPTAPVAQRPDGEAGELWGSAVDEVAADDTPSSAEGAGDLPREERIEQALAAFTDTRLRRLAESISAASQDAADRFPPPKILQGWPFAGALACLASLLILVKREFTIDLLKTHWERLREQAQAAGFGLMPERPLSKQGLTALRSHLRDLRLQTTVERALRQLYGLPPTSRPRASYVRDTAAERILNLFYNPVFYDLFKKAPDLVPPRGDSGSHPDFPPAVLLILAAAARITRSHLQVQVLLHSDNGRLWARARAAAAHMGVTDLPDYPPTLDQWMYLYSALAKEATVRRIIELLVPLHVEQARRLGNLLPGVRPNWAVPDWRHTITGDGTFWLPYSEKSEGPRAAGWQTRASEDNKTAKGINFVALHTWTAHGTFILDVDWADGAEQWPALDCLDRIARAAGDGLHTLVYDRVFRGWLLEYPLAAHRVMVLNMSVSLKTASTKTDGASEVTAEDEEAKTAGQQLRKVLAHFRKLAARRAAEQGIGPTSPQYTKYLTKLTNDLLREQASRPLRLGLSLYPTAGRTFDVVISRYEKYGPVTHRLADGSRCVHQLYVDDGALCDVGYDEDDVLVKVGYADCLSAVPSDEQVDGAWQVHMIWRIPCEHGAFNEPITWKPRPGRHTHDGTGALSERDTAISLLRPINRMMPDLFREGHGVRNVPESYHRTGKVNAVPQPGRVASVREPQQMLDWICLQLVNNSDVLDRSHLGSRPAERPPAA